VSLAVSFPTLRFPARTRRKFPAPQRSRPGWLLHHVPGLLSEASRPVGSGHLPASCHQTRSRSGLRRFVPLRTFFTARSAPGSQVSQPRACARPGRWPCATGLASYLSSCVGASQLGRLLTVFGTARPLGSYCRTGTAHLGSRRTLMPTCSIRDRLDPLALPRLAFAAALRRLSLVRYRQDHPATLAHSSNSRCFHRTAFPRVGRNSYQTRA
jgi:hypothetical protein